MKTHETVTRKCDTCRRSTEHVKRQKRDPRRSWEPVGPVFEYLVCLDCATHTPLMPVAPKFAEGER